MNKIKTVLIPIAGMGTRFLPATKLISKEMLTVLNKPLIDYAVKEAQYAGIENFIFITNNSNKKSIDYFSKNEKLEEFLKLKIDDTGSFFNYKGDY